MCHPPVWQAPTDIMTFSIILAFHYFYLCRSIAFVDCVGWVSLGGQVELECAWAAGLPRDKLYWKLKL